MCGIVGYVGKKEAVKILINSLSRLEYRGYDSAGVAVIKDDGITIRKKQGRLSVLSDELHHVPLKAHSGIAHTRWATHGVPNDVNAHPHLDTAGDIAVVHNGIIENYMELKKKLQEEGCKFRSETDSEVIAHLVSKYYKGDLRKAVTTAIKHLEGSYAIAVIHQGEEGRIVGARKDSPLIIGLGQGENFLASDIPAVLEHTKKVIYVENEEIVDLTREKCSVYDISGKKVKKQIMTIKWDISQAEKGGYKHFMLKEIFEQPQILKDIFTERIKKGDKIEFEELTIPKSAFKRINQIAIVACGTAYHAGLTGKYLLEKFAKIPVWADVSSEFRYRDLIVDKKTLLIVISQSGETADTLAALREAKKRGATVLAICNVLGSSIARESHGVIYTHAGPEIAVASTKAYTAQLAILYLFAFYLAGVRGIRIPNKKKLMKALKRLPAQAREVTEQYRHHRNKIAKYAEKFHEYYLARHNKSNFLYLARNINCPNALEGALKLKEISYISAEGYPAGEMKHGPIALIDENPWVVCIAVQGSTYDKMISNIQEVKARNGFIIAIVSKGDKRISSNGNADYVVEVPKVDELFSPVLVVIPLQLLAYYVALDFGYDIDKPRNLAKSVTVE